MKKFLALVVVCLMAVGPTWAVLKEKDLARTLGVLRAELATDYEKLQTFMQMYEQQGAQQHQLLVGYMNQCEQIGLMLYSQSSDNTFEMAYACQQAVDLSRQLGNKDGRTLPYDKIIVRLKREIERYDALISSLKAMPPVAKRDEEVLTQSDSILLQAIDSLESKIDSLADSGAPKLPTPLQGAAPGEDETPKEPLYLTGQQLEDRQACLEYAEALRDILEQNLEKMEAESTYYKSVREKVGRLNKFAQARYKLLQDNIFRQGGANYLTILTQLPQYTMRAMNSARNKYKPFKGHQANYSEWRGASILFITIFVLLYLTLAMLVSYIVLRWLVPRSWLAKEDTTRRQMLTLVVGTALFAVVVMVLRSFMPSNSVRMGAGLIINTAWLMEVIFLSLYIRLKGSDMLHATMIYLPLLVLSFIVVMMRILLIPNSVLNLLFPPVLLAFTLWQLWLGGRHRSALPMLDVVYSYATSIAMVVSTVAAWVGFTLLAVQIMVWWTFQLAAITTITCFYDLMEMYEHRYLARRIAAKNGLTIVAPEEEDTTRPEATTASVATILRQMKNGEHISTTWLYDLISRTLVPIMAVGSILVSIYWAAGIFEMTSVCHKAFFTNFIDQKDLIQLSLFKLCQVASLWFIFSYINYAVRSFYALYRKKTAEDDEPLNLTLARNVIAILTWGLYFIICLVILNVPKSGISIVTAGLATGLGFAMQDLIENFFYGLSLMTGRLRVGDYIECDNIAGKVESITYQSTQVVTSDGCVIAFLNKALFSKNFKNMTRNHSYELINIPVGVAYGTDVEQVRKLLVEAIRPVCQEKNIAGQEMADPTRDVVVRFSDFGDSSVDLKVMVWMLVEEKYALTARIKEIIYNTLNDNNIEIPFPQRDVHMK